MEIKPFNTPILFLIFNRPDTTIQVFEAIRKIRPLKLYIASDGPRPGHDDEELKVKKVRKIVASIDWQCDSKSLLRTDNLGCKRAVSEAISWFFKHEESGIILEDDCLPNHSFFYYCENLLKKYANNKQIYTINGVNFHNGIKRGNGSYFYSRYNHPWGWASWRRAWIKADMEIKFWPEWKKSIAWKNKWKKSIGRTYWQKIFDKMYRSEIDTWDFPWTACIWYYGGLSITPNVNLISNIGFGADATHTYRSYSPYASMKTESLNEIIHPSIIIEDINADNYIYKRAIGSRAIRIIYNLPYLFKKLFFILFNFVRN